MTFYEFIFVKTQEYLAEDEVADKEESGSKQIHNDQAPYNDEA